VRDVPLDPELAKLLQSYRRTLRTAPNGDDWLFPSARQRRDLDHSSDVGRDSRDPPLRGRRDGRTFLLHLVTNLD
jgi:integrase